MLNAMTDTARVVDMDEPLVAEKFNTRPGKRNDEQLLSLARSYATDAVPHKQKFIEYGMVPGFVEDLNGLIQEFEGAVTQQDLGTTAVASTVAGIEVALDDAEEQFERIDAALLNRLKDNAAALAEWKSASHLERAPQSRRNGEEGEGTAPDGAAKSGEVRAEQPA
jgi:hypothetical protein